MGRKDNLAKGMENFETRRSQGYCGTCGRMTDCLWERIGKMLTISCENCGTIIHVDKEKFKGRDES